MEASQNAGGSKAQLVSIQKGIISGWSGQGLAFGIQLNALLLQSFN